MGWKRSFLVLLFVVFGVVGCGNGEDGASAKKADGSSLELPSLLVGAQWLANHLGHSDLLVLDVRSEAAYAAGHVTGAVSFFTNRTFQNFPKMDDFLVKGVGELEELFGEIGLSTDRTVVICGEGVDEKSAFKNAARMFWILDAHGHPKVAVLNGGYAGWVAEGRATQTTEVKPTPVIFRSQLRPESVATRLMTKLAIGDPSMRIVDCRPPSHHQGQETIPDAPRKGRIPTSLSIPWDQNYSQAANGCFLFKSKEELKPIYQSILNGRRAIVYCNRGKQSAICYLALRLLGFAVAAYDGSWLEWSNDPAMPIEIEGNS